MKVIKKGRKQKGWAKEFICTGEGNKDGGCGAEILVEEDDLFHTTSHCRDETDYFITFKCCECGVFTDIKDASFDSKDLLCFADWEKRQRQREIEIERS